jgi:hypothetical protein
MSAADDSKLFVQLIVYQSPPMLRCVWASRRNEWPERHDDRWRMVILFDDDDDDEARQNWKQPSKLALQ